LPVVAQSRVSPQVSVSHGSLGFGSSAITEREQIERQDVWEFDLYQSYFSKYVKDLLLRPTFDKAEQKLKEMAKIAPNWDSYGAQPPNPEARACAAEILTLLQGQAFPPSTIVPSSEGGVAICFVDSGAYADIECLNTGEVLAVTYEGNAEPHVWDVGRKDTAIKSAIEQIREHFSA
jgi:hypothetical protein